MKTEQTVFNIIWIDDEIDSLYKEHKGVLFDEGITVLGKGARNVEEFESQMQRFRNVVDAIVTDANFNLKDTNDFGGLYDVSSLIKKYNHERSIPFIVFTGRDNVRNVVHENIIRLFDEVVSKRDERGIETLIHKIKEIVQKVNSKEFRIRNKYRKELKVASEIKGNDDILMNALLYEYSEEQRNTEEHFNSLRDIADSIFSVCKRNGIIPNVGDLNQISKFLDKNENDTYVITQEIMPKPLARGLWYFLDITQDASHKKEELKFKVVEYVKETQNINLFRSVLYIAMDLCLWYAKCKEEMSQPNYKRKWERRGMSNNIERFQKEKHTEEYEFEGIVRKREGIGWFYCGRYLLEKPKDGRYQEGDTIRITTSEENTKECFLSDEDNIVDRFVYLCNIRKM